MKERITHTQEQALVERARQGDHQAREEIILSLQTWVEYCARSWYRRCSWRSPLLDVAELAQIANLAMLEKLDRALSLEKPFAYLQQTAHDAIRYACFAHRQVQTYSLDVPLSHDSSETFADLLAAPQATELARCATDEPYAQLYRAIEAELTDRQRDLVLRHFGLLEHSPETMATICRAWYGARSCGGVYQHRDRALAKLRLVLSSMYATLPAGSLTSEVGAR